MLNHLNIADNLKPENFELAMNEYNRDYKKYSYNFSMTREYLISLNYFLYTYFLMKYNKDLEELTVEYNNKIKAENNLLELYNIGKHVLRDFSETFFSKQHSNDHQIIEAALEYVNKHFDEKISLADVANELNFSKNYLCYLFKTETGYRFCEYINIQRVNKAKKLMKLNDRSLGFISCTCGFSSQSHFSITFKKMVGMSPKDYRKELESA